MHITRRYFIATASAAAAFPALSANSAAAQQPPLAPAGPPAKPESPPFSFDTVQSMAAQLATTAYQDQSDPLPAELKKLDYDHYRDINYRHDRALWSDSGRGVRCFHPHLAP